jgi:hypothetical protein
MPGNSEEGVAGGCPACPGLEDSIRGNTSTVLTGTTVRAVNDLDHNLEDFGNGVSLLHIEAQTAFIGVPRSGNYGDIDVDALNELIDEDVEDLGMSGEVIDIDRERGRDE